MSMSCNPKEDTSPPSYKSLFGSGSIFENNNFFERKSRKVNGSVYWIIAIFFFLTLIVITFLIKLHANDSKKNFIYSPMPIAKDELSKNIKNETDSSITTVIIENHNDNVENQINLKFSNYNSIMEEKVEYHSRDNSIVSSSIQIKTYDSNNKAISMKYPFFSKFEKDICDGWNNLFSLKYLKGDNLKFALPDIFDPLRSMFSIPSSLKLIRQNMMINMDFSELNKKILNIFLRSHIIMSRFVLKRKYVYYLYKFLIKKIFLQRFFDIEFLRWLMQINSSDLIEHVHILEKNAFQSTLNDTVKKDIYFFDFVKCLQIKEKNENALFSNSKNNGMNNGLFEEIADYDKSNCHKFSTIIDSHDIALSDKKEMKIALYPRTILNRLSKNIMKFASKENKLLLREKLWRLKYIYAEYRKSFLVKNDVKILPSSINYEYMIDGVHHEQSLNNCTFFLY